MSVEWKKVCEDSRLVVYRQQASKECYNTAFFDLEIKCIKVVLTLFHTYGTESNLTYLGDDNNRFSAKHGYWQNYPAQVDVEDLRTLLSIAESLFGKEG